MHPSPQKPAEDPFRPSLDQTIYVTRFETHSVYHFTSIRPAETRRLVTFRVGNTGARVSLGPCQTFLESRWASENNFQAARHSPATPKQRLQLPGVQVPQLEAKFKDVYRKRWTPEAARMVLSRRLAEPVMGCPKGSPSTLTGCLTLAQVRLTASPKQAHTSLHFTDGATEAPKSQGICPSRSRSN